MQKLANDERGPEHFATSSRPMPTILRIGPYRFHFYSDEPGEPPHVHVRVSGKECKFWLETVLLARNRGIPVHDIREIERLVSEHQEALIKKYHEFHHH
jgi:protocatechuate 3,4-dioxygenase beta subunit